ncbi:HdeD family acid-resistance protein [Reyranella sp.]|uniref:HdeD family acid-resistance protein n=1 Tax=Reyranella sp. TaxID=1929291 RepID=UPI0037835F05
MIDSSPHDGRPDAARPPFAESPLLDAAIHHRSLLRWRGLAAVAFGLLVFFWPHLTLTGLTVLWGGYSFIDGSLALSAAVSGRLGTPRAGLSLIGLAGVACAAAVLVAPADVGAHLVAIVAAWAIGTGAMQIWAALKLRQAVDGEWVLALDGAGVIAFGLILALWPRLETAHLVWLIGGFALLLGSLYLAISLWLREQR